MYLFVVCLFCNPTQQTLLSEDIEATVSLCVVISGFSCHVTGSLYLLENLSIVIHSCQYNVNIATKHNTNINIQIG